MKDKVSKDLAYHRIEQSKADLKASKIMYKEKLYKHKKNYRKRFDNE